MEQTTKSTLAKTNVEGAQLFAKMLCISYIIAAGFFDWWSGPRGPSGGYYEPGQFYR